MSERTDLTRWNRAGLSRFRYVDGNAVTYLEFLRQALVDDERFPKWKEVQNEPISETDIEKSSGRERESLLRKRQEQLLQCYQKESRDMGWLIARSLARASHILTEHADAYANEGYIGTATQWDHVRRLVEMLDYHPAPPASASTWLVLIAKENMSGMVAKGFQVKHSPLTGGAIVIFETLEDLFIDSALNELQIEGWNRSQDLAESVVWRAKGKPRVFPGQVAMIFNEAKIEANAAVIDSVDETSKEIGFLPNPAQDSWRTWPVSDMHIHVSPRWKRECWLTGTDVIRTKKPHGLSKGAYICWEVVFDPSDYPLEYEWKYAEIIKADRRSLRLKHDGLPPDPDTELFQLTPIMDSKFSSDLEVIVLLDDQGEPDADNPVPEDVTDDVSPEVPSEIEAPPFGAIFSIEDMDINSEEPGGGGGLLPPAALPGIGSFLFPSPMLPMDLVKAAVKLMLSFGVMQIPSSGEFVFEGLPIEFGDENDVTDVAGDLFDLLNGLEITATGVIEPSKLVKWNEKYDGLGETAFKDTVTEDLIEVMNEIGDKPATTLFQEIKEGIKQTGPLLAIPKKRVRKAVVDTKEYFYMFNGTPDKIGDRDWVVGRFKDGGFKALNISKIDRFTDSDETETFSLSFGDLGAGEELEEVHADFRGELIAEGAEINNTQISSSGMTLEKEVLGSLKVGQNVLLTAKGKKAVLAKIDDIDPIDGIIKTDPSADSFTKGELIILGNVVLCGHGEVKPEKILGSGDATQSNQSFVLSVAGVSFVSDATMASGVRADIDVAVDGQVWEQVSRLNDSSPTDIHYTVRMTEEGFLKLTFGDGEHARRLPTGKNNIRVSYRLGTGLAGNLDSGSLEKPVKPHAYVKSVIHPADSTGGNDMEDAASLRENAPPTVLTLERAVSISDFARLAASHSSIWQANAFMRPELAGRGEYIEVVVVPADGGELGELKSTLTDYLLSHALPGVQVSVTRFEPWLPQLDVTIHVDSEQYDPEVVEADVRTTLLDTFSLKRRKLGQNLYLSEIYALVEGITGVERSVCNLREWNGTAWVEQRVVKAGSGRRVIYLASDKLIMEQPREYEP